MAGAHQGGRRQALLAAIALFLAMLAPVPPGASAAPGSELWRATYNGPLNGESATSVAISPDGSRTYVSGYSAATGGDEDTEEQYGFATVAYDTTTGAQLWATRYAPPNFAAIGYAPVSSVTSPDGSRVYVSGTAFGGGPARDGDYTTIAFDAASGRRLWTRAYNGPANGWDQAAAIAVDPSGQRVYVTGTSSNGSSDDTLTIAYDAVSGARLWASRKGNAYGASWIAASPDGTRVYVTSTTGAGECVTVAHDASKGARLWTSIRARCVNFTVTELSSFSNLQATAPSMVVSPDGRRLFITAKDGTTADFNAVVTVAYDTSRGAQLWARRYQGPAKELDEPGALAISPDGARLYMTATSASSDRCADMITIAYDAANGSRLWGHRYDGAQPCDAGQFGIRIDSAPASVAVNPNGSEVYVTGVSIGSAYATIAYGAATGHQLWAARNDGASGSATALAVSPDGARVVVTGSGFGGPQKFLTIAYGTG
jgi:DNA-binding beta-propeller fold protein YncE